MKINENGEVAETDNDEIVVDAANEDPPPQEAMTNTTAADTEEGGDDDNLGTKDGNDNNEADDIKGVEVGGTIRWSNTATTTTMKMTKTTTKRT